MSTLVPSVDDASTPKHEEGQVLWVSPRQRTQKSRTIIIAFSAAPDDFEEEDCDYTEDDLTAMGVRVGYYCVLPRPQFPPLRIDDNLLHTLREAYCDDPETFRLFRRNQQANTCFKSPYGDRRISLHLPRVVDECLIVAMVRLCSQNPNKDVTLVRDLCISSEERPILIPHANGGHDIPLVVSAPYAAFYHDRNPELKEKLLGPHEQVFDTLSSHPNIIPFIVCLTPRGMMDSDLTYRLPALVAARALMARTGAREVRVCVTNGVMFTFGLLAPMATFQSPSPWDAVWRPTWYARSSSDVAPGNDSSELFMYTRTLEEYMLGGCPIPPRSDEEARRRKELATVVGLMACWMNGDKGIHEYVRH